MSKFMVEKIVKAFLNLESGHGTDVIEYMKSRPRIVQTKPPPKSTSQADPNEPFAKHGEPIWMMNNEGQWIKVPWSSKFEEIRKEFGC